MPSFCKMIEKKYIYRLFWSRSISIEIATDDWWSKNRSRTNKWNSINAKRIPKHNIIIIEKENKKVYDIVIFGKWMRCRLKGLTTEGRSNCNKMFVFSFSIGLLFWWYVEQIILWVWLWHWNIFCSIQNVLNSNAFELKNSRCHFWIVCLILRL